MTNPVKPPESLGSVPLNSGTSSSGKAYGGSYNEKGKFIPNSVGEMRREVDPEGRITTHPVRRSGYVHERLHNLSGPQKLADELYDAAEKFRMDFEKAQLSGNYARLDLFKTRGGEQEMTDRVAIAKSRVAKAQKALASGGNEPSFSQSCVWHVVGLGRTLEDWTQLIRNTGKGMNTDKAAGVFHVSLERLAVHYGMLDMGRLSAIGQSHAYARGVRDCIEFVNVFAATANGPEKNVIGRFLAAAAKRFGKFS
jgi:hypothetical protein